MKQFISALVVRDRKLHLWLLVTAVCTGSVSFLIAFSSVSAERDGLFHFQDISGTEISDIVSITMSPVSPNSAAYTGLGFLVVVPLSAYFYAFILPVVLDCERRRQTVAQFWSCYSRPRHGWLQFIYVAVLCLVGHLAFLITFVIWSVCSWIFGVLELPVSMSLFVQSFASSLAIVLLKSLAISAVCILCFTLCGERGMLSAIISVMLCVASDLLLKSSTIVASFPLNVPLILTRNALYKYNDLAIFDFGGIPSDVHIGFSLISGGLIFLCTVFSIAQYCRRSPRV